MLSGLNHVNGICGFKEEAAQISERGREISEGFEDDKRIYKENKVEPISFDFQNFWSLKGSKMKLRESDGHNLNK